MNTIIRSESNILDSDCSILVCFVNTEGKDNPSTRLFGKSFPTALSNYKSHCQANKFEEFGKVLIVEDVLPISLNNKTYLICFIPSTINFVEDENNNLFSDLLLNAGLNSLYRICLKANLNSIGFYYNSNNGDSMPISALQRSIENQFLNSKEEDFELVIYS